MISAVFTLKEKMSSCSLCQFKKKKQLWYNFPSSTVCIHVSVHVGLNIVPLEEHDASMTEEKQVWYFHCQSYITPQIAYIENDLCVAAHHSNIVVLFKRTSTSTKNNAHEGVSFTFDEGISFDILRKTQHCAFVVSTGNLNASITVGELFNCC